MQLDAIWELKIYYDDSGSVIDPDSTPYVEIVSIPITRYTFEGAMRYVQEAPIAYQHDEVYCHFSTARKYAFEHLAFEFQQNRQHDLHKLYKNKWPLNVTQKEFNFYDPNEFGGRATYSNYKFYEIPLEIKYPIEKVTVNTLKQGGIIGQEEQPFFITDTKNMNLVKKAMPLTE